MTCLNQPYVAHVFQMLISGESKVKKHGWGREQQICHCLIPGARHPHPPNPKPSNTRGQQDAAELCDFGITFQPSILHSLPPTPHIKYSLHTIAYRNGICMCIYIYTDLCRYIYINICICMQVWVGFTTGGRELFCKRIVPAEVPQLSGVDFDWQARW